MQAVACISVLFFKEFAEFPIITLKGMFMLYNLDVSPNIPADKLPLINYSLLLSTLATVQAVQAQVAIISYQLDKTESSGNIEKEMKKIFEHNVEEIKIELVRLFGL